LSAPTLPAATPGGTVVAGLPTLAPFQQGFTAQQGFWQVFFTAPTGSRDPSTYFGGIDVILAAEINKLQRGNTLDIAAYQFNLPSITAAVIAAHQRGVVVRMVADTQYAIEDDNATVKQLIAAGIPVVGDVRSAFMHNKFMIVNRTFVVTGSWNYTINDTYRNNNNALFLRSRRVVELYQAEFNQMFAGTFGPRKAVSQGNSFTQDGVPMQIYFSPQDQVMPNLIAALSRAESSIRFMNFSFTDFDTAKAIIDRRAARPNLLVQGIFETTGSETAASEMRTLLCAGMDVKRDGNPFVLHHKVFIVDERTVVTGSFNISTNATRSNDENLLIIEDPALAAHFVAEFERRWAEARVSPNLTCN
jgi:phosphatidylserine/phosphatidylglycerophosphate/cardiolipin synthase-like enzyme